MTANTIMAFTQLIFPLVCRAPSYATRPNRTTKLKPEPTARPPAGRGTGSIRDSGVLGLARQGKR